MVTGGEHSLALKVNGSVVAWGNNDYGQCTVPAAALSGVIAVAAGFGHSLAMKADGLIVGWGLNNYIQCIPPSQRFVPKLLLLLGD